MGAICRPLRWRVSRRTEFWFGAGLGQRRGVSQGGPFDHQASRLPRACARRLFQPRSLFDRLSGRSSRVPRGSRRGSLWTFDFINRDQVQGGNCGSSCDLLHIRGFGLCGRRTFRYCHRRGSRGSTRCLRGLFSFFLGWDLSPTLDFFAGLGGVCGRDGDALKVGGGASSWSSTCFREIWFWWYYTYRYSQFTMRSSILDIYRK